MPACNLLPMTSVGLALLLFAAKPLAQSGGHKEPIPLMSQAVSSAVVATWGSGFVENAIPRLQFLVLWRGTPGWIYPGAFGTRSAYLGGTGDNSILPPMMRQQISVGNITFALSVDVPSSVARIGDEEISLHAFNVILVDHVDSAGGPQIVRRMWVAPEIPASDRFEVIIQREPELRAFLRCDVQFQDPSQQAVARLLCSKTLQER